MGRIGVLMPPLANLLAEVLRQQACVHAEETSVRQFDSGSGKIKHALWAYCAGVHDEGPPIVVFDYRLKDMTDSSTIYAHNSFYNAVRLDYS